MQVNKVETTKKIRILDIQMDALKKSKQRFEITAREVDNLSETCNVYAAVGRMFVLSSVPEIKDDLKNKQAKCETVVGKYQTSKDILTKNLKDQENALRELVDAKKKESK
jgi:prefoldin subunit 1